ncbi:carbonic anhydrase [Ottowia thiooxydans]|uniref:carbonic anhydrase n=1 Tax=Ottowia thiooxydans TaxID=219182 RepID=UPI00040D47DB|nr:carbonic anhydrase [Ottowia thiooxydans]
MLNRRNSLKAVLAASSILLASKASARQTCAVQTKQSQGQIKPDEALALLRQGNERFVSGKSIHCDLRKQVHETSSGQAPFAAIVGCIDSRASPELIFDQRLGDIFAARIAGNFVNDDIIGSLEFATEISGARAIVVLGHSDCGAMKGAVDNVKAGLLTGVIAQIRPSLEKLDYKGVANSSNAELVGRLTEQNVRDAIARLTSRSEMLRRRVEQRQLVLAGGLHDVRTGRIHWISA